MISKQGKWEIATTTGDFELYCMTDKEKVKELYLAGFRYIDLSMYNFSEENIYMKDGWQNAVKELKTVAEEFGVQFVQAHSPGGNPLSEDKAHVDFLVDATIRSIEVCGMLGIKNTVVHSGTNAGISKEQFFIENKKFYEKLLPTAKRCDVNVLCENSTAKNTGQNYFTNSGKDLREFIEYVNDPYFHGCWDTGHANCEGNQYEDIIALGKELYAIHYNDNCGTMDEHLAPFMGILNNDEVISALIKIGFKGPFTLESGSCLRPYSYWLGGRRDYKGDKKLSEPQLFMQRKIEELLYVTAEHMLKTYDLL